MRFVLFHICTQKQNTNRILPPLPLLLHRDDVFPITFLQSTPLTLQNGRSSCFTEKIELDHSIAFFIALCVWFLWNFEIWNFHVLLFCVQPHVRLFPSSLFSNGWCARRSLSYFSKYIIALKYYIYISCALYT